MNYNNLNQVHDYWISEIFPNLHHHISVTSFDDYLKRMSCIPSGQWLRDLDSVKILRAPFVVDPVAFSSKYKKHCVAYCCPTKPEDGIHRIIYQLSPSLHVEAALWAWVENNSVQSYMSMFLCFHCDKEVIKFFNDVQHMRRTGDTEEKPTPGGFKGFFNTPKVQQQQP